MRRSNEQPEAATTKAPAREPAQTVSEPAAVRKKVRKVEDYEVMEPVTQPQARTIAVHSRETVPDEPEYVDPVEQFLADLDEEQGYMLRVDRLPQFRKTGIWNRGAPKEFQGEIPFSVQTYMLDIQALYGPGDYLLSLRESGGQFVRRWLEHIGAPAVPANPPVASQTQTVPAAFAQAPTQAAPLQRDPIDEFLQQAEKIAKLRKAMGWDNTPTEAKQVAREAQVVERPLDEKIVTLLLDRALEKDDKSALDGVLDRYLAPPKEEFSWKEIIAEIAKPILPVIAQAMMSQIRAQQIASGQPVVAAPAQLPMPELPAQLPMTAPPGTGVTAQDVQTGTASQELVEDDEHMDLIDMLVNLLQQCVNKSAADPAVIEAGYKEVQAFSARNPLIAAFVKGLASGTPEMVLGVLVGAYPDLIALQGNQIALQTIAALQAKLRGN